GNCLVGHPRSLADPGFKQSDVLVAEPGAFRLRRHARPILAADGIEQHRFAWLAGHDDRPMPAALADKGGSIKAQLAALANGTVTGGAARAEDRLDVAGIVHVRGAKARSKEGKKEDHGGSASHEYLTACRRRRR